MKPFVITFAALLAAITASAAVRAADDPQLQRLALCQDSWLDWKDDAVRMGRLMHDFETRFDRGASDAAFVPRSSTSVLGSRVTEVYPQSVGTGVGFSLTVNTPHAQVRARIEQQLGKKMQCSTSDGFVSCAVELGAKKTALLMTEQNGQAQSSLVGCYYFYQQ